VGPKACHPGQQRGYLTLRWQRDGEVTRSVQSVVGTKSIQTNLLKIPEVKLFLIFLKAHRSLDLLKKINT
jgi:hypothetical protein